MCARRLEGLRPWAAAAQRNQEGRMYGVTGRRGRPPTLERQPSTAVSCRSLCLFVCLYVPCACRGDVLLCSFRHCQTLIDTQL